MKHDVLMIIKTIGLEYDDRLKKECLNISRQGKKIKIIVLDDSNKRGEGIIYNSIPFKKIKSISRRIFSRKKFLILKFLEMNLRFMMNIFFNRSKIVWIHNFESILLVPFLLLVKKLGFINRIIWDQHELIVLDDLPFFLKSPFRYGMSKVDYIIQANNARKQYVVDKFNINESQVKVIENLVDEEFLNYPIYELPDKVRKWLEFENFYLAQGGASTKRNFMYLSEAFLKLKKKLIVIGPIQDDDYMTIRKKNNEFDNYIYFTGMIPQIDIIPFIDKAKASIIFYSFKGGLNFKYCAPNRLYQAISRGTPVIVGANPTMKEIIDNFECGVCTNDEGNQTESIIKSVIEIEKNYNKFKRNSLECSTKFNWRKNELEINKIIV